MKMIKYALYSVLLFLIFLIVGFWAYHTYQISRHLKILERYSINSLSKYYSKEIILTLGANLPEPKKRKSHFLKFSSKKPKDTIRIGAFGDSHTYGAEVSYGQSYPTILQELFKEHYPRKKIEILNFGKGGQGFQQQFFLWEYYHEKYQLDYVLLGPKGFQPNRDTSFTKNWTSFGRLKFPRSRFILLKNNDLDLVSIDGDTLSKKFKNYYRLTPPLTSLQYDSRPFQIYEKYFPFLREKLKNPFYYSFLSQNKESFMINKILLEKIKKFHNKKLIVLLYSSSRYKLYKSLKDNLSLNAIPKLNYEFPYVMYSHGSTLSNELLSQFYFHALIGKKSFQLDVIKCPFQEQIFQTIKKDINFDKIKKIEIIGENISLGKIILNKSDYYYNKESSFTFNQKGIKSLLILFSDYNLNKSYLRKVVFPIPHVLTKNSIIYIKTPTGKASLGKINSMDKFGKVNYLSENYIITLNPQYRFFSLHLNIDKLPLNIKRQIQNYKNLSLFVDDFKLGRLVYVAKKDHPEFDFDSLKMEYVKNYHNDSLLITGPSFNIRHKDLPKTFNLYFNYIMEDGKIFKSLIPGWSCYKQKQKFQISLDNFEPIFNSNN